MFCQHLTFFQIKEPAKMLKISIFTPTHNTIHLQRLYDSIRSQTYQNWEWVIVPNNGVQISLTPPDDRIKIHPCDKSGNIGLLKKFACEKATGEILAEVDHDDELFADCLEEVAKAFQDPSIDFVYSNCVDVDQNWNSRTFGPEYGWKTRPCNYKGKQLTQNVSFSPDATSISKIWFAPNHIRAWRANFYHGIGGHDITLDVCDDHDIVCRTYIHGKMYHINKCLYVYHLHEENTCYGEKNAKIQEMTLALHDKYIYQIAEKWCDENGLKKIDLCGGHSKPLGYLSVDMLNGDIIADLNERWPFEDGEVGLFRAHDALEHLKNPIHTMQEAYRCLTDNGWFLTMTPSTDGRGAFQDPTHVSFWNSNSFWYYCKSDQARYINNPVKFQLNRIKNFYPNDFCKLHEIVYVKADLVKFTSDTPGLKEI